MSVYVRFIAAVLLACLVAFGIMSLKGMSKGDVLTESRLLDVFMQYILSDSYIQRYISHDPRAAYDLIEKETVRKIVRPFAEAMTYAALVVAAGVALWWVYARFLAWPRRPSEVRTHAFVWWGLLLVVPPAAAGGPAVLLLEPAVPITDALVRLLTLVMVGSVAAFLYIAWTYLLTPSLLRPALPLAWRLGR